MSRADESAETLARFPQFKQIDPARIEQQLDEMLADSRQAVADLLQNAGPYDWDNLAWPLQMIHDRLDRMWSPVRHLHSVQDSEALRAAYDACLPKLSAYFTELGQNHELFEAYRQLRESAAFAQLDAVQQKIIDDELRDFRLSGVHLQGEARQRYGVIQQRLSELSNRFEHNLLDASRGWQKLITDPEQLRGVPAGSMDMLRQQARHEDQDGWLLTLDYPVYNAVMSYAEDGELRREMYTAWVTRASDQGPNAGRWDNSELMAEILALRQEKAELLGYDNYATYSLVPKMAVDTDEVEGFLLRLARRSRPAAEHELQELREFAHSELGLDKLEVWDIAYCAEKLKHRQFSLNDELLKPYFPAPRVIDGLFNLVGRLFGISIQPGPDVEVWHPDVTFHEVRRENGEVVGHFYLDLYARKHKRGGAWMDDCVGRLRDRHRLQTPIAFLTCNLSPPVGDAPALFTHDEVQTLFHEFGHGLHHLLTRIDYPAVSGISGVEWDAVELPSQFMENFTWTREGLDLISGHYQTGATLPDDMFHALVRSRRFHAGLQMLRQLEFALFDLRMHRDFKRGAAGDGDYVQHTLDAVRAEISVLKPPAFNRFQHSFSHIFAGGYAAGYYSYKWAEVLSADAFGLFEEQGILNPQAGRRFLEAILERGGSKPARELYREFRQRDAQEDALLRQCGLDQAAAA